MNRVEARRARTATVTRVAVISIAAGLTLAACRAEPADTVTFRDRLPIDSLPGVRPALEADSVVQLEAKLATLLEEADEGGQLGEVEADLYDTYTPGASLEGNPGQSGAPASGETPADEITVVLGTDVARLNVDNERVPPARTVFGTDDRGTPTDKYPYRAIGKLVLDAGHCTATLVGPRHILTASHCFLPDGTYERAVFVPYYNDGQAPHGWSEVVQVFGSLPTGLPADNDFAVGILDRRLGDELGWFGWGGVDDSWFVSFDQEPPSFVAAGYSGDWFGGHRLAADWGAWLWWRFQPNPYVVGHDGDVVPGASGGPIFARFGAGDWRIIGIIVAGPQEEWAPEARFRPNYANWLVDGARFAPLIEYARTQYP
jgi:V8-like Glu-specific endopeptidase